MRAIHTFWFKPFFEATGERSLGGFSHPRFFWYSLTLSLLTVRKIIGEVDFYTDSYGHEMVKALRLPYRRVVPCLDSIPSDRAIFWNYGKYLAYHDQSEPFLHLDADVYVWKALPEKFLKAQIFGQSLETLPYHRSFYGASIKALRENLAYWPKELLELDAEAPDFGPINCGLFGGSAISLIRSYSSECLRIMDCPENRSGWEAIKKLKLPFVSVSSCSAALEQFCVTSWCKREGIVPEVLLPGQIHDEQMLAQIGYTHLIAEAKRTPAYLAVLEERMEKSCARWKEVIDKHIGVE